ncbi:hypothetical protein D3C71_1239750 [compost metagenome]
MQIGGCVHRSAAQWRPSFDNGRSDILDGQRGILKRLRDYASLFNRIDVPICVYRLLYRLTHVIDNLLNIVRR